MRIKPIADKVLVKRLEPREKSAGGIVIPDTAKEKPQEGEVIAVGPGRLNRDGKREGLLVKKGDKILFPSYGGTDADFAGEEYIILAEEDIIGIFE